MLKLGDEANKKYATLKEEYRIAKMKLCGNQINIKTE